MGRAPSFREGVDLTINDIATALLPDGETI
jgi:hypothetical protein